MSPLHKYCCWRDPLHNYWEMYYKSFIIFSINHYNCIIIHGRACCLSVYEVRLIALNPAAAGNCLNRFQKNKHNDQGGLTDGQCEESDGQG